MLTTPPSDRGPSGIPAINRDDFPVGYGEPDGTCQCCGKRVHHGFSRCVRCGGTRPFHRSPSTPDPSTPDPSTPDPSTLSPDDDAELSRLLSLLERLETICADQPSRARQLSRQLAATRASIDALRGQRLLF